MIFIIICFWLIIWELTSFLMDNHLVLVGPIQTFTRLMYLSGTQAFWSSIFNSLVRVVYGFTLALFLGIVTAILSKYSKIFYMFVLPLFNVIKSIPVVSFVIIAIFWVGSVHLSIFISFITVIPIIFFNTYKGLENTDKSLLDMAYVLDVPLFKKIRFIYFVQIMPYILSAIATGFGFAWKSGIAAELIGTSRDTIGFNLHMARVFLQTADVFAWTVTIVLLCYIVEKGISVVLVKNKIKEDI